jgi:NAD(P)-dependent dehydrogenase (short-subunit alcohol dehydrogenase family)
MSQSPSTQPSPRTVLVTGAAGGLGRAFALGFAGHGDRVAVADLDEAGAAETARLAADAGAASTWAGPLDVSSVESTEAVARLVAELGDGRIDVLVNNAAVYAGLRRSPLEEIDPAEFDRVMAVNVRGPWLMVRAASPFLAAGSSVVNVASATVLSGSEQWLHYVASKGAVVAMTRVMAKELGRREIRVNTLAPGFVLTEASYGQLGEDAASYGVDRGALRRASSPEDLVGSCLFLAGDASGFVTGQMLVVDGGRQFV